MNAAKQRLLLGLSAVLLLLIALNSFMDGQAETSESVWRPAWGGLRLSEVSSIWLQGDDGPLTIVRSPGGWMLAAPDGLVADTRRVEQLLEGLISLSVGAAIEAPDLTEFGLGPGGRAVTLSADEESLGQLSLGRRAPAGNGTYVLLGDSLHMSQHPLAQDTPWTVGYFRTREVLRFAQSAVTRVDVGRADSPVQIFRDGQKWSLGDGAERSVEPHQIAAFLSALSDLRVVGPGDPGLPPQDTQAVSVHTDAGAQSVEIWRQDGRWWANSPLHSDTMEITPGLEGFLSVPPEAWRARPADGAP